MSLVRRMRNEPEGTEGFFGQRVLRAGPTHGPDAWANWLEDTTPRVEEFQEEGTMVVRAEMPGIDPDRDVEITVSDSMLRIKAERRQENKTEDKKGYRSEFRYGSFVRSITLPAGATDEDVKATYHDGILEVRLRISVEQAEGKKIPVARG